MSENTNSKLDLKFTIAQHPAVHTRNVLTSATRALAVVAMQDVDDEPTDAAPIPPLEIITGTVQDAEDMRDLAEVFAILADAVHAAADQMDAQSGIVEEED